MPWVLSFRSSVSRARGCSHVACGLRCDVGCGILPDQGSNRDRCDGRQILVHWTTREVQPLLNCAAVFPFPCQPLTTWLRSEHRSPPSPSPPHSPLSAPLNPRSSTVAGGLPPSTASVPLQWTIQILGLWGLAILFALSPYTLDMVPRKAPPSSP